jgi:Protein of unknown function (DUF3159)
MVAEPAKPAGAAGSVESVWSQAARRGLGQAGGREFSFQASVGGVRGIIESVLPYTVFSLVYSVTKNLQTSIIAAAAPLVVLVIWRLIARERLTQAISGIFGVALGAYLAHRTGKAADFFLPNILKNLGFAAVYAISILVRWPLIGVLVGPMTGELFAWRDDRPRYVAYRWATWIWVGMFLVRLLVQVPLFLANDVGLLGTLNGLVLGLPLFALTIWLSWLVLRSVPLAKPPADPAADNDDLTPDDLSTEAEAEAKPA